MSANTELIETQERFEALVASAEAVSQANPRDYRERVIVLAILGHVVLFGTLAALIGVLVWYVRTTYSDHSFLEMLFFQGLIFPIAVLMFVLGRALWARVEPPTGYRVDRDRFPELFAQIDELTRRLKTPRLHEVRLSTELNACVVQTPVLGPLGWTRNSLMLGVPLLMALTPEQARAVLAHELGHLSGNHGRSRRWLYRTRDNWCRVMSAYSGNESWGGGWMRRFFEWYAPFFGAYSFVLARGFEYEADAIAVELTSAEHTAMALVASELKGAVAGERFWKPLKLRAERQAKPVPDAYTRLARFFLEYRPRREELLERISEATHHATGPTDTHPSLRDRLAAIKAPPDLPRPMHATAAEVWLGKRYDRVLKQFDADWVESNGEEWEALNRSTQDARQRLKQLRSRPVDALSAEEIWEQALLTERLLPKEDPLGLYWAYHKRRPADAEAELALGRILLARQDPRGLPFVKHAAEDSSRLVAAAHLAIDYLERTGDPLEARLWQRRMEAQLELDRAAARERAGVRSSDSFEAAGLPKAALDTTRRQLNKLPGVQEVWVARKRLNHFPERPLYVLVCRPKGRPGAALEAELIARAALPGQVQLVWNRGASRRLAEKVMRVGEQVL